MQRFVPGFIAIASMIALAACGADHGVSSIAPSPTLTTAAAGAAVGSQSAASLLGTWVSSTRVTTASTISLAVCSNIQMQITSQTATQATGTLSMDCPEGIRVSGTIVGQLGAATIPLRWDGTATQSGFPSCSFSLTGVGTPLTTDSFHITYSGSSCTGPIDGADNLRLATPSAPSGGGSAAPPAAAPSAPVSPSSALIPGGDTRALFLSLVAGRPFGQQTLLDLQPTLARYQIALTPPNAAGDRTKIGDPISHRWVRVGFGEGHWVWVVQSAEYTP
jgi:hypothetical protein